jgi:hypothetical protein
MKRLVFSLRESNFNFTRLVVHAHLSLTPFLLVPTDGCYSAIVSRRSCFRSILQMTHLSSSLCPCDSPSALSMDRFQKRRSSISLSKSCSAVSSDGSPRGARLSQLLTNWRITCERGRLLRERDRDRDRDRDRERDRDRDRDRERGTSLISLPARDHRSSLLGD